VIEESWSWWHDDSVHVASWPEPDGTIASDSVDLVYEVAAAVLSDVRKEKSNQKRSLASPVVRAVVSDTAPRLAALDAAASDVREAGKIVELVTAVAADGDAGVAVELAPLEPTA
jgi:valyl-tRNA synthetase